MADKKNVGSEGLAVRRSLDVSVRESGETFLGEGCAKAVASGHLNTDDSPLVEFGFARSLGRLGVPLIQQLRDEAIAQGKDRPAGLSGRVDWEAVERERLALACLEEEAPAPAGWCSEDLRRCAALLSRFLAGDSRGAVASWEGPAGTLLPARSRVEAEALASSSADLGDDRALPLLARLRSDDPLAAQTIAARLSFRQGRTGEAVQLLADAFKQYRTNPWPWPLLMSRALELAREMAAADPSTAGPLLEALREPFAVRQLDQERLSSALMVAGPLGKSTMVEVFRMLEPYFIWREDLLAARASLYEAAQRPEAARARRELASFRRAK